MGVAHIMETTTKNYLSFISETLSIIKNCEGSGLAAEIELLATEYASYFATSPIPVSVAKWVENLFDLLDNLEGSELEQELKTLTKPKKITA